MNEQQKVISDVSSLTKTASSLRLRAKTLAESMRLGSYSSMMKGQGVDFAGVREYLHGDDIRTIDWNVTARMGKPFVKLFEEEKELIVFFIVDRSLSMETGSKETSRLNISSETGALLLLAASNNSCPVGGVFFDGDINFSCPPKNNQDHTLLLLSKFAHREKMQTLGSSLSNSIRGASKLLKKRSLVFILSDFRATDYSQNLARLAQKHEVVAIRFTDANDISLPNLGLVNIIDPETKQTQLVPTNSISFQRAWKDKTQRSIDRWKHMCQKSGVATVLISTADDPVIRLSKYFGMRG